MLFSVLGLLYLAQLGKALQCSLLGQTATTQTGYNFVVDYFYLDKNVSSLPVPYAVDMCTVNSMTSNSTYFKYTCGNNSGVVTVTKTKYSDPNCTQSAQIMDHWFQGESEQGEIGYFECDLEDGYVEMTLTNSTTCSSNNTRTVYFGLGGCGSNKNYSIQFTCTNSQAILQVFLDLNVPPGFNSSNFPMSSSSAPLPSSSEPSVNESFSSSNSPSSSATPIGGGGGGGIGKSFGLVTPVVCQMFCDQVTIASTCVDIFPGYSIYGTMGSCFAPNVGGGSTTTTTGSASTTTTAKEGGSTSLFTLNCFLLALVGTFFLF